MQTFPTKRQNFWLISHSGMCPPKRPNLRRISQLELFQTKRPNFALVDVSPKTAEFSSYFALGTFPTKRPNES
ncbi:MAG: hypothetical protein Q8881_03935 [Sweet potato little leaf phytoplasma]|nr:hypothetical protein [Sweet potato little leaf phytoplasma]